jgi:adenylosuccinate synthase
VITKLDVLSRFESIKVCVAYEYEGERLEFFPPHQTIFNKCRPVYEEVPGWSEDVTGAKSSEDLPKEARAYLELIESLVGTRISWVSVGPGREQTVAL